MLAYYTNNGKRKQCFCSFKVPSYSVNCVYLSKVEDKRQSTCNSDKQTCFCGESGNISYSSFLLARYEKPVR